MNAILHSLNAVSASALTAVLNSLWLALAFAAAIWLALRLMPRINAATRHAVWWAVLALVTLLPFAALFPRSPALGSSLTQSQTFTQAQSQPRATSSPAAAPLLTAPAETSAPLLSSAPQLSPYSRAAAAPRALLPIEFRPGNWPSLLFIAWLAVCFILLSRIAFSYMHLRALRKRSRSASAELISRFSLRLHDSGTRRIPQLLISRETVSPLAAGFLHPVVILPELLLDEIAESELDYVLLHELAHVARRDDWTNLAGRLAFSALVLHPVAAWVLRRIEREREIACDDWVVAATGSAIHYAATLAHLFETCCTRRRELLATGMAHRSSNLGERIEMLLRPRFNFASGASPARVSLCVAASIALLAFGLRMPSWIALASKPPADQIYVEASAMVLASESSRIVAPPESTLPSQPTSKEPSSRLPLRSAAVSSAISLPQAQDEVSRHEWKITRSDSSSSKVNLALIIRYDDGDRMNTQDVPLSSLRGFSLSILDHDGPVKFEYVRNAGTILCEGVVSGGRAFGPFTIALDPAYVSAVQKMGYAAPKDDEAFSLVVSDVTLDFVRAIRDTGLTSSIGAVVELKDHGVSAEYVRDIRRAGFTSMSAYDISGLRDHGVEPAYLKGIKAVDPNLSIDAIDNLRDHGVEAAFYKSMKAADPALSIGAISELRDHGAEPQYYASMRAVDPNLSIKEVDTLRDHGVESDFYKEMKTVDPKISINAISELRDHGVEPHYYGGMKAVDPSLSVEEIDSLRDHGVESDFYKEMKTVDPKISINAISELHDHGVEPRYYGGMKAVDPSLSVEEIDRLRDHGVESDFYKGFKAFDPKLSIDAIDELRDHGVEPGYLQSIRALGDGFSISDVAILRDHGVTPTYIRNLHDMGMKNLTATQILRLRDARNE
jgi:beta-lactamase regulating signal transducer with metallopeptidase domain